MNDDPNASERLERLLDSADIASLINRLGAVLDEGPIDEMRRLFVDRATARTPGGLAEGIEAMIAQAARNHPAGATIQHVITNVEIDVQGDHATARANLIAHFVDGAAGGPPRQAPPPRYTVGEVYHFEAERTPGGWRLSSVEANPRWSVGERLPVAPIA